MPVKGGGTSARAVGHLLSKEQDQEGQQRQQESWLLVIQEGEGYYREKDGEVEQVLVTLNRLSGGGPGGREGEEEK